VTRTKFECQIASFNLPNYFVAFIAGRPDSVANCSQLNHSADTVVVQCTAGFDGGLAQLFTVELRYLRPAGVSGKYDHTCGVFSSNMKTLSLVRKWFSISQM
jgi:hypothetical protein